MTAKKSRVELVSYIFCTIFSLGGVGMSVAGLLLPFWYEIEYVKGQVLYKVNLGLWQDRICEGHKDCEWTWTSDYDRADETAIPSGDLIKVFETVGTALGVLSLLTLAFMWKSRNGRPFTKYLSHVLFFGPCMLAAFACVTGTLILASKGDDDLADWAAFMSGVGGALMFLSGCLACVVCRFDPSYGTLENPVSPRYISA